MVRQRAWSNRTIHKSLREHSPQGRSDYFSLSVHEDVVAPLCWASVVRSDGIQRIHGIPSEDLLCCVVFHCDYLILVATVEHEVVVASRCLWSHVKIAEDERLVAITIAASHTSTASRNSDSRMLSTFSGWFQPPAVVCMFTTAKLPNGVSANVTMSMHLSPNMLSRGAAWACLINRDSTKGYLLMYIKPLWNL
eukprot:CAMPEP_0183495054 /NCGR_PEP_ID=MMETSP0370-20130417/184256_1 /TAXON_ID=268820 /ORGANISM="Peridinium aciculiferum, Strain PAER-2" /LENGTH=193 /DNA_ID=CAMNT_0025688397 /DNA_START=36 /DNA_END=618 /DNA_ORIENTATION=-